MNPVAQPFRNPFRPGAGHMPPFLAGRDEEIARFEQLLGQETILENLLLTGLRGVGKTVLLETLKPIAIQEGWLWVGTDLSESASISEERLATRLLTDLSVVTSSIVIGIEHKAALGFQGEEDSVRHTLTYATLTALYESTPGLVSDKLKRVLEVVWAQVAAQGRRGIIFAYDEAQNLADHANENEYPLSLLLDVFQSLQRKDIAFMLALTGLPTLVTKLVEARTFSERMFHVIVLDRLTNDESREAIVTPIARDDCPVSLTDDSIHTIIEVSGGYPYFIQFICKEVFDIWLQKLSQGELPSVPTDEIVRKLDTDFFAARWSRATDRQRDLLSVAARLETAESEFTVQELVNGSKSMLDKPFSSSHVSQMLATLIDSGLIFKNRYGKYSFAVPLLNRFIGRELAPDNGTDTLWD